MKRIFIGLLVILLAGAGYYGWTRYQASSGSRLDVQTAALARGDVRRVISTSGTVKARVTVDVSVQVSGQISERPADYNTLVRTNDLLARIDPAPFETKIRQLDASIDMADASVASAKVGVDKATINLAKAQADYDRAKALTASGSATVTALETADNANKLAKADLAAAQAQLQNANASLAQRRAEMESAQIDLTHTYIRAPIDGVVVDRTIEVGQTVAASSSAPKLFTLAQDLSSIDIAAPVDEADVAQVAVGNPVTFRVDAFPDVVFSGEVGQVRIAPVTQQNVVTYTVLIRANNPGNRLLPGMTANLDIVTGERRSVLVVSNEALRFQPRGAAATLVSRAPAATAAAPAPTRPASAGGPGGAPADLVATLQRDLNLDDATMTRIRTALRDQQATARTAQGAGGAGAGGQARAGGQGQQFAGGARPGGAGGGAQAAPRAGGGGAPGGPGAGVAPGGGFAAGGPPGPGGGPAGPPPDGGNPGAALTAALADDGIGGARPAPAQSFANDPATQLRLRTDEVLRDVLTPEQFAQYQALQFARDTAPRTGTIWTREADGTIASQPVQLGLAGLNTTEVLAGLAEGAPIVLRVREAAR